MGVAIRCIGCCTAAVFEKRDVDCCCGRGTAGGSDAEEGGAGTWAPGALADPLPPAVTPLIAADEGVPSWEVLMVGREEEAEATGVKN